MDFLKFSFFEISSSNFRQTCIRSWNPNCTDLQGLQIGLKMLQKQISILCTLNCWGELSIKDAKCKQTSKQTNSLIFRSKIYANVFCIFCVKMRERWMTDFWFIKLSWLSLYTICYFWVAGTYFFPSVLLWHPTTFTCLKKYLGQWK